jgi:hypothetical protein
VNLSVTGGRSGLAHAQLTGGRLGRGHIAGAPTTVTVPFDVARSMFVDGGPDLTVLMGAFTRLVPGLESSTTCTANRHHNR